MLKASPVSSLTHSGYAALDPCVHCGFCLPACPTYLVTGDEGDSPRGRIMLMRSLERGEMSPNDPGLLEHLDGCLGCRGCEPACPSGVGYGRGLEAAREQIFHAGGLSSLARLVLGVFRYRMIWRPLFAMARAFRATGLPKALAGRGRVGFGMALITAFSLGLAATLTAAGLAVLYGGRLVERLRPERRIFGARFAGVLPALSATIIVLAGTLITLRAIPELG